ncbi:hypothetical protein VTL71DRAFT_2914 [Oculimacula yallundae]|uniref:Uncharacterized protein n=1 Tax=Oculimacula yallundae TaxID=86028 RepID=A0ABR4C6D5_9HELO
MQDSPLSITASIAGILTFAAAILAFVYIRYNTLKDGYAEMDTIFKSVESSLDDTRMMKTANPDGHLGSILKDLFRLERRIMAELLKVYQNPQANAVIEVLDLEEAALVDPQGIAAPIARKKGRLGRLLLRVSRLVLWARTIEQIFISVDPEIMALGWRILVFVRHLGMTPFLLRWYMTRDKVLVMTRRRESLRSRMLFIQMSHVNTRSISDEDSIRKLREEVIELREKISAMHDKVMGRD